MLCLNCNKEYEGDICPYCEKPAKNPETKPKTEQEVEHEPKLEPMQKRESKLKQLLESKRKLIQEQALEHEQKQKMRRFHFWKIENRRAIVIAISLILIIVLGWPMYKTISNDQKEKGAIVEAKNLLADGYVYDQDITKVNWGKYDKAKNVLATLSANSKYKKDANDLLLEITAREAGAQISQARRIISNIYQDDLDIGKLKTIKGSLTAIQPSNQYYQQAQDTLPYFIDALDAILIQKVKQSFANGNFVEVKKYLVDVSQNSKYKAELIAIEKDVYVQRLEDLFLANGMKDVKVSIIGNEKEHLFITYARWTRPLVMKFADVDGIRKNAKIIGFRRVTFDTGNRVTFSYDL